MSHILSFLFRTRTRVGLLHFCNTLPCSSITPPIHPPLCLMSGFPFKTHFSSSAQYSREATETDLPLAGGLETASQRQKKMKATAVCQIRQLKNTALVTIYNSTFVQTTTRLFLTWAKHQETSLATRRNNSCLGLLGHTPHKPPEIGSGLQE